MKIGIVGLGLIGGSFAKAYKKNCDCVVYGYDTDRSSLSYAHLSEIIDEELCDENISLCDILILALYPDAAVDFLNKKAHLIKKDSLVIDTCGTKRRVCEEGFRKASENGFVFVGGHPMAGIQFSGIKHSAADMFENASMVIVPPSFDDIKLLDRVKTALLPARFGKLTFSTAENHDKIIAYTSQLAHVVSNAYAKSETAPMHHGFSAGSYKDMTRVATLNENMWSQLFIENREFLSKELSELIDSLTEYKNALDKGDSKELVKLLSDGCQSKMRADG